MYFPIWLRLPIFVLFLIGQFLDSAYGNCATYEAPVSERVGTCIVGTYDATYTKCSYRCTTFATPCYGFTLETIAALVPKCYLHDCLSVSPTSASFQYYRSACLTTSVDSTTTTFSADTTTTVATSADTTTLTTSADTTTVTTSADTSTLTTSAKTTTSSTSSDAKTSPITSAATTTASTAYDDTSTVSVDTTTAQPIVIDTTSGDATATMTTYTDTTITTPISTEINTEKAGQRIYFMAKDASCVSSLDIGVIDFSLKENIDLCNVYYQRTIDNNVGSFVILFDEYRVSTIQCSSLCLRHKLCSSFTFEKLTKNCQGLTQTFYTTTNTLSSSTVDDD